MRVRGGCQRGREKVINISSNSSLNKIAGATSHTGRRAVIKQKKKKKKMQRDVFTLSLSIKTEQLHRSELPWSPDVAYFHINNFIFYMSITFSISFFTLSSLFLSLFLYHSAHSPPFIISGLWPSQFSISFSHFFDHFVYSSPSALILLLFPESGWIRCGSSLMLGETLHSSLF